MADKGHTELPWRVSTDLPHKIIGPDWRRPTVSRTIAVCGTEPRKYWTDQYKSEVAANVQLIITAANTYPAVEGLVEALGSALNELTACARQLNAKPGGSVMTAIVRGRNAAARFRSYQNGGAE